MTIEETIKRAAVALQSAEALLITAGAGMGVDSGLPDFRGTHGFWRAYPAISKLGLSFQEMADPDWFRKDPRLAWAFYGHRLNLYRSTVPHPGFDRLLKFGGTRPGGCFVFTSNVDGQFQKAGFDPELIVECHGSIHHFQCTTPCSAEIWDAPNETVEVDEARFQALEPLPRCRNCKKAVARPNVLMFGDRTWLAGRTEALQRRFEAWLDGLGGSAAKLVVIELGAGNAIPTVRYTSERICQGLGCTLIRINPRDHEVPTGQIGLPFGAAEGIQRICDSAEDLSN